MEYTTLLQRGIIDISLVTANPMWSVQRRPFKHLLENPQDGKTLCGHTWSPGDTLDDCDILGAVACGKCIEQASKG